MESIDINKLCENEYDYDKNKTYEYINIKNFGRDIALALIDNIEKINNMPNNFLNFVFTTYLDRCKKIIYNDLDIDGKNDEDKYAVSLEELDNYNKNKFAIIIMKDIKDSKNQQFVFYCNKTQDLYDQHFLKNGLMDKNYFNNLELSITQKQSQKNSSRKAKSIKSNKSYTNKKGENNNNNLVISLNVSINIKNDNINIQDNNNINNIQDDNNINNIQDGNNINNIQDDNNINNIQDGNNNNIQDGNNNNIQDDSKNNANNKKFIQNSYNINNNNTQNSFSNNNNINNSDINNVNIDSAQIDEMKRKKEKDIDNYIRGNVFENEVSNYLKNKILNSENKELPNIFYTIRNLYDKDDKSQNIKLNFFNEFDAVFMIENDINFDDNILKINFKYENKIFENNQDNKAKNTNNLIIKGKNLVFVECKYEANYNKAFEDGKLFKKIYKFRDLIDKTFGTKGYGVIILYLYNTKFIYETKDFNNFKNAISTGFSKCLKEKDDVLMYNVFSFYINASVYMFNYSNVYNEIKDVKEKQQKTEKKLNDALNNTRNELNNTKNELDKLKAELDELKVILNNMNKKK